jgi:hypothetical protein
MAPPEPDALELLALLLPDDELLFVRLGTDAPMLGGDPLAVGGLLGSEGTAGTVGPELLLVPAVLVADGVTTVVAPVPSAEGMTVGRDALNPRRVCAAPPIVVLGAVGVADGVEVLVPLCCDAVAPPPTTLAGAPPSGRTHTTSRFEQ